LSTGPCQIKVVPTAPSDTMRANEIAIETANTGKVTVVVTVMSIFCETKCNLQSASSRDKKPSCQKAESANYLEENSHGPRNLSLNMRNSRSQMKLAPKA
jgi:hypothetical protein